MQKFSNILDDVFAVKKVFNLHPWRCWRSWLFLRPNVVCGAEKRKRKLCRPLTHVPNHFWYFNAHFLCSQLTFDIFASAFFHPTRLSPPPTLSSESILKKAHHIWWVSVSVYQNDIANLSSRSECFDSYTYFHA